MRSLDVFERVLRASFGGILASVSVASVAACSSQPTACGGCGCADSGVTPYNVTYTVCSTADAGTEAGSDGGVDAGACFATCFEACAAMKPASAPGTGVCMSQPDAGAGETVTASCQAEVLCTGRKLEGLENVDAGGPGAWLAKAAWLEAASVHAFLRLERELELHGAPTELIERARVCARDEARHARMMRQLARERGARVPRVAVTDVGVRTLERIALENAVEGCVGETYGALYAAWQSTHETDADIARAMRAIAPDELRHAALGWAVAAWIEPLLTDDERTRVEAARLAAARDIMARASSPEEHALATGLMREVWAA
jgi:hypothetical protein